MKIGVLGNIANFGYITAKNLFSLGLDVEFIDELDYIFLYSLPSWSEIYEKIHYSNIEETKEKLIKNIPNHPVYHQL